MRTVIEDLNLSSQERDEIVLSLHHCGLTDYSSFFRSEDRNKLQSVFLYAGELICDRAVLMDLANYVHHNELKCAGAKRLLDKYCLPEEAEGEKESPGRPFDLGIMIWRPENAPDEIVELFTSLYGINSIIFVSQDFGDVVDYEDGESGMIPCWMRDSTDLLWDGAENHSYNGELGIGTVWAVLMT